MGMINIGCCGFPVARKRYYEVFSIVELQQTFYQLPKPETARKWREEAPPDFEFTLKAWQGITHLTSSPTYRKSKIVLSESQQKNLGHFKPTSDVFRAWEETVRIAEILEAKVIVLQTPPNFKQTEQNVENLNRFLQQVTPSPFILAIEFRSPWESHIIRRLGEQFGIVHCVDPFKENSQVGDIRYYRLHGSPPGERMYRYKYTESDFQFLKRKLQEDLLQPMDAIYLMFNNLNMWEDAREFIRFWEKSS